MLVVFSLNLVGLEMFDIGYGVFRLSRASNKMFPLSERERSWQPSMCLLAVTLCLVWAGDMRRRLTHMETSDGLQKASGTAAGTPAAAATATVAAVDGPAVAQHGAVATAVSSRGARRRWSYRHCSCPGWA